MSTDNLQLTNDIVLPVQGPRQRIALALHVNESRCLSCAGCISVCPRMHVPISNFNSLAEGILCRGCGLCVQVCPVEALSQVVVQAPEPRVPLAVDKRRPGPGEPVPGA